VPAAVGPSAAGSLPTSAADSKSRGTQVTGSRSRKARGSRKSAARAQAASVTPAAALPPPPTSAALPGMPPSPGLLSRAAAAVTGLFGRQEAMTPPRHRADSAHAHQAVDGPLREVHRTRSPALRTSDGHSGPPSRDLSPVRRSLQSEAPAPATSSVSSALSWAFLMRVRAARSDGLRASGASAAGLAAMAMSSRAPVARAAMAAAVERLPSDGAWRRACRPQREESSEIQHGHMKLHEELNGVS